MSSAAAVVLSAGIRPAVAADRYWQGTSSNSWTTSTNWLGFTPPGVSDRAVFDIAGGFPPVRSNVTLDASRSIQSMIVNGDSPVGAYTFTRSNNALLSVADTLLVGGSNAAASTTTFNGFAASIGGGFATLNQATATLTGGSQIAAAIVQTQASSVLNVTNAAMTASTFNSFDQSRINVSSGGTLSTTGTGLTDIQGTSKVTIGGGGTLNLAGDLTVFGGELVLDSASAFTQASGRTLLATGSGAKITFNRDFALNTGTTLSANSGADIVGSSYIDIGNARAGTLTLDGSGSTLTTGGTVVSDWGRGDTGAFTGTVSNNASASLAALRVGTSNGTAGLTVSGSGSLTSGTFEMGGGTSARNVGMTINNGTFTANGTSTFNNRATVNLQAGTMQLNANTTFNSGSILNWTGGALNFAGVTLNINGGAFNRNGLGREVSNGGTLSLTAGGTSTGTSYFDVANVNTTGTLIIDGTGSLFTSSSSTPSDWGLSAGHTASVALSNAGQANFVDLRIGTTNAAANVSIASGAILSTSGTLTVGGGTTARTVAVNVAGGTLTTAGTATLNNAAVLTLSGGLVNFSNGATVSTGATLSRTGGGLIVASGKTLDITGGAFNRNGLDYEVSNGSTLRVLGGGQSTGTSYFDVANVNPSGSLVIDGSGTLVTAGALSDWGYGSGRTANVAISNLAQVNLTATGNSLRIGTNNAASTVAVSGMAKLNLAGTLGVGGGATARTVVLNVVGGTLTAAGAATFDSPAVVNLGTSATTGSINFNGGAILNAGSALNWYSGNLNVAAGKTLTVSGGTVTQTVDGTAQSLGSTLTINNGGTYTSANYFDVRTGTLNVTNAGSSLTVNGSEDTFWTYASGDVATVNITDGGVATYNSGLSVGNGGGVANVTINSGGRLNTLKLSSTNGTTTINVNNPSTLTPALSVSGVSNLAVATTINLTSGRIDLGQLTMSNSARIIPAAATNSGVIAAASLSMTDVSRIDVASGRLELSGAGTSVSANLRTLIGSGYNGGDWQGLRVTSSAAAASGGTAGLYYGPSGGLTVAKLALYGDADGDGGVSINDFNALAANFGQTSKFWVEGDFDYDGGVSINDFNRLAANFGKTLGVPAPGPNYAALVLWDFAVAHHAEATFIQATGVPEPTGLAVLAAGGLIGLRRRSRR